MRSSNITNSLSAADIITLSKARRQAAQTESGTVTQALPRAQGLTLPDDVVTLSSQQPESNAPTIRKKTSLQVTPTEKKALLETASSAADSSPYRISIFG